MTTNETLIMISASLVAMLVAPCTAAHAASETRCSVPPVALEVNLERSTLEAREPVIAQVMLTNLGDEPLRLPVRDDGTPLRIALDVSNGDSTYSTHSLWLTRNGPHPKEVEVLPGKSTSGDVLVLLDFGVKYVFASPGAYRLRWHFYAAPGCPKIYTDEVRVSVLPSSRVNEECLARLQLIGLRYHVGDDADTLDLNAPEAESALNREGILLLAKIISRTKPHLITPGDRAENALVDSLQEVLERYPDSAYSGYIARYLGLVHLKTLEHAGSLEEATAWRETGKPPTFDAKAFKEKPAYQKALKYLTQAAKADLWPATTAQYHLGWLHLMARDWEKAEECCGILRKDYAASNGLHHADELRRQLHDFRAKVERAEADTED